MNAIFISNSFPFSLIRRRVVVEPREVGDLLARMHGHAWVSAWGHANTVEAASTLACADLRPKSERPALVLGEDGLPSLDGLVFDECWLLSPDFVPGYRPAVGEEVAADRILGWQVLQLAWDRPSRDSESAT
jgi:hypothetical protein